MTTRQGSAIRAALEEVKGQPWTYDALNEWLSSRGDRCAGHAHDVRRAFHSAKQRADVIAYLRTLSHNPVPLPAAEAARPAATAERGAGPSPPRPNRRPGRTRKAAPGAGEPGQGRARQGIEPPRQHLRPRHTHLTAAPGDTLHPRPAASAPAGGTDAHRQRLLAACARLDQTRRLLRRPRAGAPGAAPPTAGATTIMAPPCRPVDDFCPVGRGGRGCGRCCGRGSSALLPRRPGRRPEGRPQPR